LFSTFFVHIFVSNFAVPQLENCILMWEMGHTLKYTIFGHIQDVGRTLMRL